MRNILMLGNPDVKAAMSDYLLTWLIPQRQAVTHWQHHHILLGKKTHSAHLFDFIATFYNNRFTLKKNMEKKK